MDEDALFAFGSVLAAISGVLERRGICSTLELAETIGNVGLMTHEAGYQYERRAKYILQWAHMLKAAADGAASAPSDESQH